MTVDLEEEQDPPSFKAARKKDKERLQKVFKKKICGKFINYGYNKYGFMCVVNIAVLICCLYLISFIAYGRRSGQYN